MGLWDDALSVGKHVGGDVLTGGLYDDYNVAKGAYNKGAAAVGALEAKAPPGVGGPAQDPSRLVKQVNGTYLDPATGTTYTDPTGATPVAAPNVAQQVAGAGANSQAILNRVATQDQRGDAAYNGQQALSGELDNVIRNPNAPSVAQQQLNQTMGNIDRQQLSGVAGVGGANAAGARQQAFQNLGNLDLQAAGQGALLRANEVAAARNSQENVLQGIAGNANTATGQDLGTATDFSQQAMTGATTNQALTQAARTSNQNLALGVANGVGGAATKALLG